MAVSEKAKSCAQWNHGYFIRDNRWNGRTCGWWQCDEDLRISFPIVSVLSVMWEGRMSLRMRIEPERGRESGRERKSCGMMICWLGEWDCQPH